MEYTISETEIKRRKLAYSALSVSLIIGTFISSIVYQFPVSPIIYLLLAMSLLLIGTFSLYFFEKISILKIILSKELLQRKSSHSEEDYFLTEIKKVKIKWTTNNNIREIYIWMSNDRSVFLTGLKSFEKFRKDLLARIGKQVAVQEWREPINFDGWWFYPLLGLLISNLSILAFKNLINLNYHQFKFSMWLFAGYLITLGLYFILATPIAKRSGKRTKIQDYIMGTLILVSGICVFIYALIN